MKNQTTKDPSDYVPQHEAERITRLERTQLYRYRMDGSLSWVKGKTRRILYFKPDLYKLIGLQ